MKVKVYADFVEGYGADIEIDYPKNIEVYIDVEIKRNVIPIPENTVRFWATSQPEGDYNELIKQNQDKYHYLLTAFDDLLQLPNASLFIGCGSWIEPDPNMKKEFGVSTIMSGRNCLPGHKLRRELWERRHEIKIPFDFYLGTHNILPGEYYQQDGIRLSAGKTEKKRAFNRMFHITIDSYKRKNHYSEKLIDPLVTKTVPIYWGCINLQDYFDSSGILEINTVDDIIYFCNGLTESHYDYFLPAIEHNYKRGVEESNYGEILKRSIEKCLI